MGAVGVWIAALSLGIGCSSNPKGPERSAKAVESMQETRAQLVKADQQVAATIQSLQTVMAQNTGDLRPAFNKFAADVRETRGMAEGAAKRAQAMRAGVSEYVDQWQAESKGITDPELREKSQERMSKARAEFDRIQGLAQETREAYQPWMQQLTNLQTYLSNDLTVGGVRSAQNIAQKAVESGQTVRQKIGGLQAEMDRLSAAWSSRMGGTKSP